MYPSIHVDESRKVDLPPIFSNPSRKACLLHGGGLDSTALFIWLLDCQIQFDCLTVDYGQVAHQAESASIKRQCTKYSVDMVWARDHNIRKGNEDRMLFTGNLDSNPEVTGRNEQLIDIAVKLGYTHIFLGLDKPHSGTAWADASTDFLTSMNQRYPTSIISAPFIEIDKAYVYQQILRLDPNLFGLSMTCWTPINDEPCGTCKHCKLEAEYKSKCLYTA